MLSSPTIKHKEHPMLMAVLFLKMLAEKQVLTMAYIQLVYNLELIKHQGQSLPT
jgi:hypothetical protein